MGKSLIIKGADFSVNAVSTRVTQLYYDKNQDGVLVPLDVNVPTASTGVFINRNGTISHQSRCAITDFIDVSSAKSLFIHSIFNKSGLYAYAFYDSTKALFGTAVVADSLVNYDTWADHEVAVPQGAAYVRIGWYKDDIGSPQNFYVVVN